MKTTLELSIELTNLQTVRQARERKVFLDLFMNGMNLETYEQIKESQRRDGLRRDE